EEHERKHVQRLEETQASDSTVNIREKRVRVVAKYSAAVGFLLILGDILSQQITYPLGNSYGVDVAYVAVPFFILSAFAVVYAYSSSVLKRAWNNKWLKLLSITAGIVYALFYIFVTNMVSTPDLPMPPDLQGFILPFQVYDHLAVWPDIEFWSPQLNLVGYFSVGSVLVVSSLVALMSFTVALLVNNIRTRRSGIQRPAAFVGSFVTSLSTNACCCCAPVILPGVFAILGLGVSNPIAEDVTYQTMPIFNLLWISTLMFLLFSILFSAKSETSCKG
ncbi:MAG: hypothetical protein M1587_10865, partial [Thaumarchaeota archaeon]|nr:hypothetical protein [Nitrososphaerota archaeon]